MKSEKSIEKMLKKHYKKAERAAELSPHKNMTVDGQTVSLYAPRRNVFVSAAAFAIYGVGLASMVILFVLAGRGSGLIGPEQTDDIGAAGSVSDTVMVPSTDSPVTNPGTSVVYEEIKLGEQLEFIDEVQSDADMNRLSLSLKYWQSMMDEKSMIAVITLLDIQFDPDSDGGDAVYAPSGMSGRFSYMVEKILVSGEECTLREGNIYTGTDSARWLQNDNGSYIVRHFCFELPLTDIGGQYVVYINEYGFMGPLTSNLNGRHKNLDWEKYANDVVQCEADCIAAYREQIEKVLTYLPTKDGVEEFKSALAQKEPAFKNFTFAECYNITTSRIRKEIGGEIFRFMDDPNLRTFSNEAYLVLDGEIYELTMRTDNGYITSILPCDFDGDGNLDLIYTCSTKSDLSNTEDTNVYVFNTVTREKTKIFSTDTAPKALRRTLVLTEGGAADGKHFNLCFSKYTVEGATTFVASPAVCGSVEAVDGAPRVTTDARYDDPPETEPNTGGIYRRYEEIDLDEFKIGRVNLTKKYFYRVDEKLTIFPHFTIHWDTGDYLDDHFGPEGPHNLFDGDTQTKWVGDDSNWGNTAIVWSMKQAVYVDGYTITTGNDHETYRDRSIIKWRLYGANVLPADKMDAMDEDGLSYFEKATVPEGWVLIDAVDAYDPNDPKTSLIPDKNFYEIGFEAQNPGSYKYFMLLIDDSEYLIQLSEFTLYGSEFAPAPQLPELEPLSDAKRQEIKDAWYSKNGGNFTWTAYYGTYDGKVVLMLMGDLTRFGKIEVAGQKFLLGNSFTIWVYDDGEFYKLQDAYDRGILTESQIADMASRHAQYVREKFGENYYNSLYGNYSPEPDPETVLDLETAKKIIAENDDIETILAEFKKLQDPDYVGGYEATLVEFRLDWGGNEKILFVMEENRIIYSWYEIEVYYPHELLFGKPLEAKVPKLDPLTDEKRQEIEDAWLADRGQAIKWKDRYGVRYYGSYGDCVVLFEEILPYEESELFVAGRRFALLSTFRINVYRDGKFESLENAYEKGLLSKEQVWEIADYHRELQKDYWGDGYYDTLEKW